MDAARIGQVRRFNRTVTQRVGALSAGYLARDRPLGASRLLWEIGTDGGEVRAVRARLGLDSGHMSRLLRALEGEGLVRVDADESDRRVRVARLTRTGRSELRLLDRRSDELAESMLAPLDAVQRDELVSAMGTVERLLTASMVEIRVTDPDDRDARRCIRAYFSDLDRRSESGFDSSASIAVDRDELIPPAGHFLVAYLHGEPAGCGGVKHLPGHPAEIKRMWVSQPARGRGIGRRLLSELEGLAASRGASVARLDTNRALVEAIAMYRSAGYEEVPPFNDEPFAHHWFQKSLGSRRSG
jgi:DNA-binding MarR family transcriptional regulator/GNAT superfamily N-acetyltransferase